MPDNWPNSRRFDEASTPYLHAIGVLSLEYNSLENSLCDLIDHLLSDVPRSVREQIFRPASNKHRIDILRCIAESFSECAQVKSEIAYFCDQFPKCSENRNLALHSIGFMDGEYFHLYKHPLRAPFWQKAYSLNVEEIRKISEDFRSYSTYCWGIEKFMHARFSGRHQNSWYTLDGPLNLPERPRPPIKILAQGDGAEDREAPILF